MKNNHSPLLSSLSKLPNIAFSFSHYAVLLLQNVHTISTSCHTSEDFSINENSLKILWLKGKNAITRVNIMPRHKFQLCRVINFNSANLEFDVTYFRKTLPQYYHNIYQKFGKD